MFFVESIGYAGGLFSCLTFIHFASDFIFQSHSEAMVKHNNPKIRAKHCGIYTLFFIPWMMLFHFDWWKYCIAINILFWSHFLFDTYVLVFYWAKYIRRPPEMNIDPNKGLVHDPRVGFKEFVNTTLGKILMITIDQISHIAMLWVLVILTMVGKQ